MPTRIKALVADDAAENRKLIKSFLYFCGVDAETAEDGLAARRIIESGKIPELLVSDIEMPNMNGFELLAWVKKNPASAKVPVIMLSTLEAPEVIDRCKRLGAAAYIVKPFTKEKMESAIKDAGLAPGACS